MQKTFTITSLSPQEPFPLEPKNGSNIPKNLKMKKESYEFSYEGEQVIETVAEMVANKIFGENKLYILNY